MEETPASREEEGVDWEVGVSAVLGLAIMLLIMVPEFIPWAPREDDGEEVEREGARQEDGKST
jgi:hypothetical protein